LTGLSPLLAQFSADADPPSSLALPKLDSE
jgi:hypothetical protein